MYCLRMTGCNGQVLLIKIAIEHIYMYMYHHVLEHCNKDSWIEPTLKSYKKEMLMKVNDLEVKRRR